jgi:hypothetical protein
MLDAKIDAAMRCGTFDTGQVSAACLNEILRILGPGALFAFGVKRSEWVSLGFGAQVAALGKGVALSVASMVPDGLHVNSPDSDGMRCLVWRVYANRSRSFGWKFTLLGVLVHGSF